MKKTSSLLAVLVAAGTLAIPAMAHDRDDYNNGRSESYGAYNTYKAYDGYNRQGYTVPSRYTVTRTDSRARLDNRSRDRGQTHRDAGYGRGDNDRR